MTNLQDISHYFKMEICCDREKNILMLLKTTYLKVVLEFFGIIKYNLSTIFMDNGLLNTIMRSFSDYQALFKTVF